ncbi:hypothetical protein P4B35_04690 [Pontiellaceae bacterium B12227]|nr:hypothetical protein [Pontiellaceae bacterium B12227]
MNQRILITVKTYPAISKTYGELVCTAGINEDGQWIRLYPVPFRKMEQYRKYEKYQWLTASIRRRARDVRPESYSPAVDSILLEEGIPTGKNRDWEARKDLILRKGDVYDDLADLIARAKNNHLSVATFKPADVFDVIVKPVEREWDKDKLAAIEAMHRQGDLFADDKDFSKQFRYVRKLPYEFSYRFADVNGKESTLMIEDWELGALYWNCIDKHGDSEEAAIQKVKDKFMKLWTERDLYLFLGTTKEWHFRSPNPFLVVGVFYPPKTDQLSLW